MQEDASKLESRTEVSDEVLSYAFSSQTEKVRKGPLIDTGTDEVFIPRSKFAELVGLDKSKTMDLLVINTKNSGLISMNALPPAFKCLKEWDNEKGYLTDNCLTAQDKYKGYLDYFRIAY